MTAGRASQIHRGRAIKVLWKGFMEQPLQVTEGVDFVLEVAHGVWTIGVRKGMRDPVRCTA